MMSSTLIYNANFNDLNLFLNELSWLETIEEICDLKVVKINKAFEVPKLYYVL